MGVKWVENHFRRPCFLSLLLVVCFHVLLRVVLTSHCHLTGQENFGENFLGEKEKTNSMTAF